RMLSAVTETAPPGTVVAIVADPGRQFEPALSIVDQVAYRGRADLPIRLVPVPASTAEYTEDEAALARNLPNSIPLLQASAGSSTCADVGAVIVLVDPSTTQGSMPCFVPALRAIDFRTTVVLWGGETVSLRPRLPGMVSEGYRALLSCLDPGLIRLRG